MTSDQNEPSTSTLLASAMADLERASGVHKIEAIPATISSAITAPYGSDAIPTADAAAVTTLPYTARRPFSGDRGGASPYSPPMPDGTDTAPHAPAARLPARRTATGTTPPPIPEAARRSRTTVTTDPSGRIHAIGLDAGVDVDMTIDTALDQASATLRVARELARHAVQDIGGVAAPENSIDALFAQEPGRELADLVDRGAFALAANDDTVATVTAQLSPLFHLINDLDLDPQPS